MRFLRDLLSWFFRGGQTSETKQPPSIKIMQAQAEAPASKTADKKRRGKESEYDALNGAKTFDIMAELRAIEPVSREFSKAREDLIQELKKLAPKRRPIKP